MTVMDLALGIFLGMTLRDVFALFVRGIGVLLVHSSKSRVKL